MATGASTADLALVVLDVASGLKEQTRRHLCIAALLGVRSIVVAVNKLDLVGYSEEVFDSIESDYREFAGRIGAARYSRQDIFWVPQEHRERYFLATEDPETFELDGELRDRVRYQQHDLLTLAPPVTGQSLIVCKNVLMHFSPEAQVKVLEMFHQALVPGGYLALDGAQAMPEALADRFPRVQPGLPLFRRPED